MTDRYMQVLYKSAGWIVLALLTFCSCKNDFETINALTSELKLPDLTGYDVEIVYHDSGMMQGRIITPELNRYDRVEEPYIEFPQGLKVYFYDGDLDVESYIQANYAIFNQKTELWEARNNVVAENLFTGEKLETDQLFWDQENRAVYSEKFSKITNKDGVFYGEDGFDANEDLTQLTLKGARGTAYVSEGQAN
ncbi:MAG: LPS export ABC transporter periplasmic protein LptC [Bacteroidales bacterium]|nr:LPS export ABC transporter periplasmic protein LptC [Bacteroidales bacterium]